MEIKKLFLPFILLLSSYMEVLCQNKLEINALDFMWLNSWKESVTCYGSDPTTPKGILGTTFYGKYADQTFEVLCNGKIIGYWMIKYAKDCQGERYFVPGENYSSSRYNDCYNIIEQSASKFCSYGMLKPSYEEHLKKLEIKSENYTRNVELELKNPIDITQINKWHNLTKDELFSFYHDNTYKVVENYSTKSRTYSGKYEVLSDTAVIIEYQPSNSGETIYEKIKISCYEDGNCMTETYRNGKKYKSKILPLSSSNARLNFEKESDYIKNHLSESKSVSLGCQNCYWQSQPYSIGESFKKYSKIFKDTIVYTCKEKKGQTYWSSINMEDPLISDLKYNICYSCSDTKQDNSPGHFQEGYDPFQGWYYSFCLLYRNEDLIECGLLGNWELENKIVDSKQYEDPTSELNKLRKARENKEFIITGGWEVETYFKDGADAKLAFNIEISEKNNQYSAKCISSMLNDKQFPTPIIKNIKYNSHADISMELDYSNTEYEKLILTLHGQFYNHANKLIFGAKILKKSRDKKLNSYFPNIGYIFKRVYLLD